MNGVSWWLLASRAWAPLALAQPMPAGWPTSAAACAACHAAGTGEAPRLAGLQADYLVKQMRVLSDGERPADAALRAAHGLGRDDARRLANVLAGLPVAGWPAPTSMLGRRLYEQGDLG